MNGECQELTSSEGTRRANRNRPVQRARTLQLETIRLSGVGMPRYEKTNRVLASGFTFPGGLHHCPPDRLALNGSGRHAHALFAATLNLREVRAEPELIELGPNVGARRLTGWPATLPKALGMGQQLAGDQLRGGEAVGFAVGEHMPDNDQELAGDGHD